MRVYQFKINHSTKIYMTVLADCFQEAFDKFCREDFNADSSEVIEITDLGEVKQ